MKDEGITLEGTCFWTSAKIKEGGGKKMDRDKDPPLTFKRCKSKDRARDRDKAGNSSYGRGQEGEEE